MAAIVARHDAPPIGEDAATLGRTAEEGGDEHAGVKKALSVEIQLANARGERRDHGRAGSAMTHAAAFVAATTRRFSTNTPQRACATEGGDEHTVVRRALSVRDPALWQSAEAHCPSGLDERFV